MNRPGGAAGDSGVLLIGYEDEENLGMRSIAAYLMEHGIPVRILPCQGIPKERILDQVAALDPKIVGFSLIFQRMFPQFAGLISYLRERGIRAHLTMGGHFPTLEYDGVMRGIPGLDSIIRHEGEETLRELYLNLDRPDRWREIPGLVLRDQGTITPSKPRPLISDLDSLPFPIRADDFYTIRGLGVCSILASRGCFYNCSFCSIHQFYHDAPGPKRRTRSPSNVAAEMAQLYARGIRIFSFKDDDLGTRTTEQRRWIEEFAREIKDRGFSHDILWRISCRVDEVEVRLLSMLREVGLQTLYLGIESGSEQGLKTANKHYHVDDIYRAISILEDIGMDFAYGFMLFDPDSTFRSLRENIRLLEYLGRSGRVTVRFTKMFPYVGTLIEKRLKAEGRLKGSLASPDYEYADPRLNLLEVIISQTFHNFIFEKDGLGKQLEIAQNELPILRKFFPKQYDLSAYSLTLCDITRRCNESVTETLTKALNFVETQTYEEILGSWWLLELLKNRELSYQEHLKKELQRLGPAPVA